MSGAGEPGGGDAVAEALAAACGDPAVLARIGGPLGEAARAALGRMAREAGPEAQRALRAAWAAVAMAPVPAGLRGVHVSWIEAALAELPERARAELASGGASGDPAAVWLVRRACAGFPPMPAADAVGPPRSLDEAVRLRGDDLMIWLAEVGADQLALALGAAGGDAVVAAARAMGAPAGTWLQRAAARIGVAPRAGALGPVRAAIGRCRVTLDERALLEIGARAIAPHVDALARRRLAVRLPRPIGLAVAAALAAFSGAPLDQAPAWRALAAAY